MENQPQVRVRVNVGRTSKGLPSYDCTVEVVGQLDGLTCVEDIEEISNKTLAESERVEATLRAKYGAEWSDG